MHAPVTHDFSIRAGEITHLKLDLKLEPNLRSLHPKIRTESGSALPDFHSTIRFSGSRMGVWRVRPDTHPRSHFERAGYDDYPEIVAGTNSSQATFRIDDIPLAPLRATTESGKFECRSRLTEREDGDLDLDILIMDVVADDGD
ncbi:MAG: hypothetical protein GY930_01465 [bacterium]|nr:hypothetical protein [bacterium]